MNTKIACSLIFRERGKGNQVEREKRKKPNCRVHFLAWAIE